MSTKHLEQIRIERAAAMDVEIHQVDLLVPENLSCFRGHFDGDPVLPGVVQLNDAVLAPIEEIWPDLGRLEKMQRLKFIRIIRPGESIRVMLERRGAGSRVSFRIDSGGATCTSGSLTFVRRAAP